jgi:sortase (surface protein transpeptidase)
MVSTNYSAYLNIAKSHIYKEKIETESRWIISSVEASNIKEKVKENKQKEEEKKEEIKEDERGSEYSINKLVAWANKKDIDLDIEITPYENRIIIPKIGKNVPLVDIKNRKIEWEEELNSIFMEELENWVIRYPWSATPGNDGTTFVFWHSSNFPWIEWDYNEVFSLLDNVVYNDDIIIYYWQKKYTYKIREKKVIKPGDVSVLKRNKNKSELTLMTCWPIGTTLKRLVVTWELVEEEI